MKRLILSAVISLIPMVCWCLYLNMVIQRAVCIESGGLWLGLYQGCDLVVDEGFYSLTISPISAAILVGIWLSLVALISLVLKRFKVLGS